MKDLAGEAGCLPGQSTGPVLEYELGELFGGILLAGLEPVHGDGQLGREFAEGLDAGRAGVGFESADVGVGDALAREFALAEAELEASLADPFPDCGHWGAGR